MIVEKLSKAANEQLFASQLEAFVGTVAEVMNAAYVVLLLRDEGGTGFRSGACFGLETLPEGLGLAAKWVLAQARTLTLRTEDDAKQTLGRALEGNILPLICIPIMSDTLAAAVAVGFPREAAEELPRRLPALERLAKLVGTVIENAALRDELRHKEEQVRDLIKDTLDAQEAERERICLEVHDGVTQTLASAFQYLQTLVTSSPDDTSARQLLIRASALVRQSIQESREVINSLQPATLRDLGLVATLRHEMRQLEQETKWQVEFKADNVRLPYDVETGLYRIMREAIANVRKHANSSRLRVSILHEGDWIKAEIEDCGVGFNPSVQELSPARRGTGLLSMRKRAELLQGNCTVESSPGKGTMVRVEIPSRGWGRK